MNEIEHKSGATGIYTPLRRELKYGLALEILSGSCKSSLQSINFKSEAGFPHHTQACGSLLFELSDAAVMQHTCQELHCLFNGLRICANLCHLLFSVSLNFIFCEHFMHEKRN